MPASSAVRSSIHVLTVCRMWLAANQQLLDRKFEALSRWASAAASASWDQFTNDVAGQGRKFVLAAVCSFECRPVWRVGPVGLEPTTSRLKAVCSAIELRTRRHASGKGAQRARACRCRTETDGAVGRYWPIGRAWAAGNGKTSMRPVRARLW